MKQINAMQVASGAILAATLVGVAVLIAQFTKKMSEVTSLPSSQLDAQFSVHVYYASMALNNLLFAGF